MGGAFQAVFGLSHFSNFLEEISNFDKVLGSSTLIFIQACQSLSFSEGTRQYAHPIAGFASDSKINFLKKGGLSLSNIPKWISSVYLVTKLFLILPRQ